MLPATISKMLLSCHWKLRQDAGPSLLPDGRIVRTIAGLDQTSIHDVVQYLRLYTDAKNSTTRACYVTDPVIDGRSYPGKWRGGEVSWAIDPNNPQTVLLTQVLLQGLLITLPASDARLTASRGASADGGANDKEDYAELTWVGVDPDARYALASALNVAAVINDAAHMKFIGGTTGDPPVAATVTLGDGWYHRDTQTDLADDGSGTVTLRLHKPRYTLTAVEGFRYGATATKLYHFSVPKQIAQSILTDHVGADPINRSQSASYERDATTCDLILVTRVFTADALSVPSYTHTNLPGYTETEIVYEDSTTEPALPEGATWGFISKRKNPDTGRWNGTVIPRTYKPNGAYGDGDGWQSIEIYENLGTIRGTSIQIATRTIQAFTRAAADNVLGAPGTCPSTSVDYSAWYRIPGYGGITTGVRRIRPGQWLGVQVLSNTP